MGGLVISLRYFLINTLGEDRKAFAPMSDLGPPRTQVNGGGELSKVVGSSVFVLGEDFDGFGQLKETFAAESGLLETGWRTRSPLWAWSSVGAT